MRRKQKLPSGYRSFFEERIAQELTDANIIFQYESIKLEYTEPLRKQLTECSKCGSKALLRIGMYTPDFIVQANNLIIETKGRFTAADRRKMLAVIDAHPEWRIVLLFMRDNKIDKNSTTYYSDWCMEKGIEFAIGNITKEWFK